jgi:hypothetical protein
MLTIPLRRASRETAAAASCLRRLRRPYQSSQAHAADAASAEPEVSVTMSKSRTKKTVDKSQLRLADAARTSMREPFPGLPPLKPAGALEVGNSPLQPARPFPPLGGCLMLSRCGIPFAKGREQLTLSANLDFANLTAAINTHIYNR